MGAANELLKAAIAAKAMLQDGKAPTKKMLDKDQWKRDRVKRKKSKKDKKKNRK